MAEMSLGAVLVVDDDPDMRTLLEEVLSTNLVLTLLGLTAILTGLLRLSGSFRDHIIDGAAGQPVQHLGPSPPLRGVQPVPALELQ